MIRTSSRAKNIANTLLRWIIEIVFPPVCAGCSVSGTWMCQDCDRSARRVDQEYICKRCGRPVRPASRNCGRCAMWSEGFIACRSVFEFDGVVRTAIHHLKYHNQFARSEWCAAEIRDLMRHLNWSVDVITAVPLHPSRLRARGYNQSQEIADRLATLTRIPSTSVIRRTRKTDSQVGLSAEQRRDNVAGAFSVVVDLAGNRVLIIDDVITTGSTLSECADACLRAGASAVYALTVATET